MEPWRPGANLFFFNLKVLSWNVVRDLSVSQISMLTAWELNAGVNGAHEQFTTGKLWCLIKHRNQGKMDGRKLLESEQRDCRGFDGVDDVDGVDGMVGTREHWWLVASGGVEWRRVATNGGVDGWLGC